MRPRRLALARGVGTAAPRAAAERGRRGLHARVRLADDHRLRRGPALAADDHGRVLLDADRARGVPRRPAALAAGPRRAGAAVPRARRHARRGAGGGARASARRPDAGARLPAARFARLRRRGRAGPVLVPPVAAEQASAPIEHDGARSPRSSTTRRSTATPRWSRPSAPPRPWRSRTSACRPSPRRGWPRCRRRASGSSRPGTPSAGGSSATSTTAHSSGSWRSRCSCGSSAPTSAAIPPARRQLATAASDELARSLEELRELARGIHPAALDHGLASALESLAGRSAVITAVTCDAPGARTGGRRARRLLRGLRGAGQRRQVRRGDHRLGAPVARPAAASRSRSPTTASAARTRRAGPASTAWPTASPRSAGSCVVTSPRGRGDRGRGGAAMRVVIADDSELLREGVAAILARAGIDVVGAGGVRRGAAARGRRARARRGDRRHPHAADVHRRGPARRARDPRPAPADGDRDPLPARRDGDGDAAAGRASGAARLPAQGPRREATSSPARCGASPPAAPRWTRGRRPPAGERRAARSPRSRPREREVLGLVAEGRSNQAIAERLELSRRGVQKHITASSPSSGSRRTRTTTAASSPCSSISGSPAPRRLARSLFGHGGPEAFGRGDQVVEVLRGGVDVDLDPVDAAGEALLPGP